MDICPHCKGPIVVRNPTGSCDHLCWPDYLSPEARAKVEAALAEAEERERHEQEREYYERMAEEEYHRQMERTHR